MFTWDDKANDGKGQFVDGRTPTDEYNTNNEQHYKQQDLQGQVDGRNFKVRDNSEAHHSGAYKLLGNGNISLTTRDTSSIRSDAGGVSFSLGVGGGAAMASADGGAAGDASAETEAKTIFDLKLVGFDAKAKIKVIKEVRSIAGLGLKEAKELVESAPKVIQKDLKQEKADELKAQLEAVGAQVEVV